MLVVAAAIVCQHRLLVQQRAAPAAVAGQWELPGGRVEPGETELDALVRECREELGVTIRPGARVGPDLTDGAKDGAKHQQLVLRVYAAELAEPDDRPRAVEHAAVRWVSAAELPDLDWLAADRVLLPELLVLVRGADSAGVS